MKDGLQQRALINSQNLALFNISDCQKSADMKNKTNIKRMQLKRAEKQVYFKEFG